MGLARLARPAKPLDRHIIGPSALRQVAHRVPRQNGEGRGIDVIVAIIALEGIGKEPLRLIQFARPKPKQGEFARPRGAPTST